MLSDSSISDMSPVRSRRRQKKQRVSSSDEESFDDRPAKKVRVSRCFRVSSSDESSENESPIKKPKAGQRLRVESSSESSDSDIPGPSKKNKSRTLSDKDISDSSDSDVVLRPWLPKEVQGRKKLVLSDSDFTDSEGENPNGQAGKRKVQQSTSSDSDGAERCIICFKTLGSPFANPSNCNHSFHEECLSTWSKTSNTCPIDRVKYTAIYIRESGGNLISKRNVTTPPPQDHNPDLEPDDPTFCEICNQHDRESEMLLCDRCEAGYHMDCLSPPLTEVPSGDWFCPDCSILGNVIHDDEVRDLLSGSIILETRFRGRPPRRPRLHPRTRAAQRVLNTIRHRANIEEPHSTAGVRNRTSTERKKKSRRKRRTRYKVALVTGDDGTTVEVKVAIRAGKRRRRKVKKKSNRSFSSFEKGCGKGLKKLRNESSTGREGTTTEVSLHSLDLFGTRPQLDYFSGCEAEDELEEDGGVMTMRRARPAIRCMAERKQIAAQIFASRPRRAIIPSVITPPAVDVLSTILQDQEKLHTSTQSAKDNERSEKEHTGLPLESGALPVRKAPGSNHDQRSGSSQHLSREGGEQCCGQTATAYQTTAPLQPPPQPAFSRLYEEEDIDLYADIEPPPTCRLAPPPEPPPMLLSMEGEDGGSSPEDTMLVIDDQHDAYDPEEPTSPPSPDSRRGEAASMRNAQETPEKYPKVNVNLDDIQLPSPIEGDNDSECPNAVMYSKTSRNIARRSSTDSEKSLKDDTSIGNGVLKNCISKYDSEIDYPDSEMNQSKESVKEDEQNDEGEPSHEVKPEKKNEEKKINTQDDKILPKEDADNEVDKPASSESGSNMEVIRDDKEKSDEVDTVSLNDDEVVKTDTEKDENELLLQKLELMKCEEENKSKLSENDTSSCDKTGKKGEEEEEEEEEMEEEEEEEDEEEDEEEEDEEEEIETLKGKLTKEDGDSQNDTENNEGSEKISSDEKSSIKLELDSSQKESDVDAKEGLVDRSEEDDSEALNESQVSGENSEGENFKRIPDIEKESEKEPEGDVLELGCEEGDRDGLVDITDEEMSTYEKNWEMENDRSGDEKRVGLEGLETEAISECEDTLCDDTGAKPVVDPNAGKEEGEIVVEERAEPITWKKLSKGTKDRSYREKEVKKEPKEKKKEKKPKEKRKELERYDVRKIISDKPKKRKTDEFGRDISNSRSRSVSARSGSRVRRRRSSRDKRRTRSRGRSRSRSHESRSRTRSRSRSRGRSRTRGRTRSRSRSRARSWSRSRGRTRSRGRSRSRSKRRARSRSIRKNKTRGRPKSKDRKRRRKSTSSCSSCSCSSCERERTGAKKLTVIVPNKNSTSAKKSKDKKKEKGKEKSRKDTNKRRKATSPVPSKEVFTSGDNILVSVNFKSSKSGDISKSKDGSKRKRDEEPRRKKDKGSKENQPLRSIVTTTVSVPPNMPKTKKRDRLNMKNLKPVAIIDLDQSPFREQTPSPKEVIILSDSDNENKRPNDDPPIQPITTGPKTPPEPHIKFSISAKPQIRNLSNPLLDTTETEEREVDEEEQVEISHKGPNTPPEPPVPYDPFEPTKSRSPTPCPDLDTDVERNPSPAPEISMCINRLTPEPPKSVSPPKLVSQHDSPKTPSPLQSPPKPPEELAVEKPKPPVYTPAMTTNCSDDVVDIGGGDSPYSPGTSEGDDLFEPPLPQITTPTPIAKVKPRPIAPQKHTNTLKLTPSPLKKRPINAKSSLKNNKGNAGKKEIGIKLDEDQLKILDELPNSAVEMQVKDKFLKKLNRQERVVEEVKLVLKPHYAKKHVTKDEYKEILRKAVPKICHNKSGEINPLKIQHLIEAYVKKYRHKKKKSSTSSMLPLNMKPKPYQNKLSNVLFWISEASKNNVTAN